MKLSKKLFFLTFIVLLLLNQVLSAESDEDDEEYDYSDEDYEDDDEDSDDNIPPLKPPSNKPPIPIKPDSETILHRNISRDNATAIASLHLNISTTPDPDEEDEDEEEPSYPISSTTEKPPTTLSSNKTTDYYYEDNEDGDIDSDFWKNDDEEDYEYDYEDELYEVDKQMFNNIGTGVRGFTDLLYKLSLVGNHSDGTPDYATFIRIIKVHLVEGIDQLIKNVMPLAMEVSETHQISPECTSSIVRTVFGIRSFQSWAIKLIDLSGKLPEGILSGTLSSLGVYDECLKLEVPTDDNSAIDFRGQYCAIDIKPFLPSRKDRSYTFEPRPKLVRELGFLNDLALLKQMRYFHFLNYRFGLCMPSTCTKEDINSLAYEVTRQIRFNVTVNRCEIEKDLELDPISILTLALIFMFITGIGIATGVDLLQRTLNHVYGYKISDGAFTRMCHSISLYNNAARFFDANVVAEDHPHYPLEVINGFKFMAILWLILGNTYRYFDINVIMGLGMATNKTAESYWFQLVSNSIYSIELLIILSTFTATYLWLTTLNETKGKFNFIKYYFVRFWQTIPVYTVILLLLPMVPMLGNGPVWIDTLEPLIRNCRSNWWINLLFVNNFLRPEEQCLFTTWFVAVDLQLYLLLPFFFVMMYYKPRFSALMIATGLLGSIALTALSTYYFELPPTRLYLRDFEPDLRSDYAYYLQQMPFSHFSAAVCGIVMAYLVANRNRFQQLSMLQCAIGYILGFMLIISSMAIPYGWQNNASYSFSSAVIFSALGRPMYNLGISWFIYIAASGQNKLLTKIFSYRAFKPLADLTFPAYLINTVVMYMFTGNTRQPVYFSHILALYLFMAHAVFTYFVSFFFSLFYEMPFISFQKDFLEKRLQQVLEITESRFKGSDGFRNKYDKTFKLKFFQNGEYMGPRTVHDEESPHSTSAFDVTDKPLTNGCLKNDMNGDLNGDLNCNEIKVEPSAEVVKL